MRTMRDFKGSELNWLQPRAMERRFELRSEDELFATLTWVKVFGSLAEATTGDGNFTLKRGGFMQPYITVRDAGTDKDIAVLKIGLFRHGTLEFSIGRRISLISTRLFGIEWEFVDENGQKLCKMRMGPGLTRHSTITIFEAIRRDRDLMVMLVAGWYGMVLMSDEAVAVSAAGAG